MILMLSQHSHEKTKKFLYWVKINNARILYNWACYQNLYVFNRKQDIDAFQYQFLLKWKMQKLAILNCRPTLMKSIGGICREYHTWCKRGPENFISLKKKFETTEWQKGLPGAKFGRVRSLQNYWRKQEWVSTKSCIIVDIVYRYYTDIHRLGRRTLKYLLSHLKIVSNEMAP